MVMRLRIGPVGKVDCGAIDAWLVDHFAVAADAVSRCAAGSTTNPELQARALLDRAVLLYFEFAKTAHFPLFPESRVLRITSIEGDAGVFEADIALAVVDHVPARTFAGLLETAHNLTMTELCRVPEPDMPESDMVEPLLQRVFETIIKPMRASQPFHYTLREISELAFGAGVPFRHIGMGTMRMGTGERSHLYRGSTVETDSALGGRICGNKKHSGDVLRGAGFPVPRQHLVNTLDGAKAAAREIGYPVVIKPPTAEQSKGVTVRITDESGLAAALEEAQKFGKVAMVESHIAGTCHRLMVMDGRLTFASHRLPKGVKGDGVSTVVELIKIADAKRMKQPPWLRGKPFPVDAEAQAAMALAGQSESSVPPDGVYAPLRMINSHESGNEIIDVTTTIHPDNAELAVAVARTLGLTVCGLDLMSTDITRPWHENGAAINEVNFNPEFTTARKEPYLADLTAALVGQDRRIPVHLITGNGDLLTQARALRDLLALQGTPCHLTGPTHTEGPSGRAIVMDMQTLLERGIALTLRPDVAGVVLYSDATDLLSGGIAVDRLDSLTVLDPDRARATDLAQRLAARFPADKVSVGGA